MKKNVRNALAISGLALAIGASGLTLTASANNQGNSRHALFERSQNPSKIMKVKKVDKSETTKWHKRTIPGIVSAISTNSIIITKGNKTLTVNIPSDTKILNRNWKTINLSDIQIGNKVRVSGTIADLTVTAKTIRNISLN